MAPEHDARIRAFYDHESDEPSPRRRRAAADWGVNEDIFDRMPSRRFARSDRRTEHREEPRFERRVSGPSRPADAWADEAPRGEDAWGEEPLPPRRDDWADEHERRQIAPRRGDWPDRDEPRRTTESGPRRPRRAAPHDRRVGRARPRRGAPHDRRLRRERRDARRRRGRDFRRRARGTRPAPRTRRPAESWTVTDDHVPVEDGKRSIDSWLAPEANQELALVPGESRTVVLETAEPHEPEASRSRPRGAR